MSRPSTPRLRDVADRAGVSTAAASLALRGRAGVSEATRSRVEAAARELRYEVNATARNLRRSRTEAIGLYLPSHASAFEFYMQVAFGAADEADRTGNSIVLLPHGGDEAPGAFVDGYVVVDAVDGDPVVAALIGGSRPVVAGERVREEAGVPAATVAVDHVTGMRTLLDHVEDAGASRIGVVLPPDDTAWGRETAHGYAVWCAERGIEPVTTMASLTPPVYDVTDAAARLLDAHPHLDGVIAVPDGSAVGVVAAAERHRRVVGRDLLVAAYLDHTVYSLLRPAITALDVRPRELGATCVRALRDVLEAGTDPAAPHTTVLDMPLPELVERQSTARLAGGLAR